MITTIISLVTIFTIVIFIIVLSIKRTAKMLKKIDGAKTFLEITELRNTLSPTKWGEDIDKVERSLINEISLNMEKVEPAKIYEAINHALRYEPAFRNELKKNIVIYLDGRLNQMRKTGTIDRKKLEELKVLANGIFYARSLDEIQTLEKNHLVEVEEKREEVVV